MKKQSGDIIWKSLVQEAQIIEGLHLNQLIQEYLIMMLIRHTKLTRFNEEPVAVSYLKSQKYRGQVKRNAIQSVGDRCLILSGLYPDIITNKTIDIDYLTSIGQSAYHDLHGIIKDDLTFKQLAIEFTNLQRTLASMRNIADHQGDMMMRLLGHIPPHFPST